MSKKQYPGGYITMTGTDKTQFRSTPINKHYIICDDRENRAQISDTLYFACKQYRLAWLKLFHAIKQSPLGTFIFYLLNTIVKWIK